jgi:AcrR family transcriptional regulator
MATARALARETMLEEIKAAARRQLVEDGAASISLRAIARELGIVSSGIYRYVASRDDLLTILIVDAYNDVGDVAEAAVRDKRGGVRAQWLRVTKAIRGWAIEHPHDYALIYGTPVPGYRAPEDTISPALRVSLVGLGLLTSAEVVQEKGVRIPRSVHADFATIRAIAPDASDDLLSRALMAWTMLFGTISYELFGHLHNVITDFDGFFELQTGRAADLLFGEG